jgi:hypothetical protein
MQDVMPGLLAQQKLAHEGGFERIIPEYWIAPVNAWTADGQTFIDWDGIWMQRAPGISLTALTSVVDSVHHSKRANVTIDRAVVQDVLQNRYAIPSALSISSTTLATWKGHAVIVLYASTRVRHESDSSALPTCVTVQLVLRLKHRSVHVYCAVFICSLCMFTHVHFRNTLCVTVDTHLLLKFTD